MEEDLPDTLDYDSNDEPENVEEEILQKYERVVELHIECLQSADENIHFNASEPENLYEEIVKEYEHEQVIGLQIEFVQNNVTESIQFDPSETTAEFLNDLLTNGMQIEPRKQTLTEDGLGNVDAFQFYFFLIFRFRIHFRLDIVEIKKEKP